MSIIVCKMPRAGLGNQLFPLMKAVILQQITGFPLMITNYHQFSIGPYLRKEKSKRRYAGYFKFQKNILLNWVDQCRLLFYRGYEVVDEPLLGKNEVYAVGKYIYMYSEMPHWDDYFMGLKEHRDAVIASFFKLLTPDVLQHAQARKVPCIGVHIRMGDFRKLQAGQNFAAGGNIRTPEYYFIRVIKKIREIADKNLPVTIFTDGYRNEFDELFDLPDVTLMDGNSDIVDLILLSKSEIIVASATSTFSYWAAFLSEAVLIMHPDHIHAPIRPDSFNRIFFEGSLTNENVDELLIKNIKAIVYE